MTLTPHMTAIGPFSQIVTMQQLPAKGPIQDHQLHIETNTCLWIKNGSIVDVRPYDGKVTQGIDYYEIKEPAVALPGFIDAHTHLCYAGSRANDYALRVSGASYQEIATQGGGILSTVSHTRAATKDDLLSTLIDRLQIASHLGVTTCEVKSGYGLTIVDEIKMLEVIHAANEKQPVSLVPTCLAAHTLPKEYKDHTSYLNMLKQELLPKLKWQNLSKRIDIFVDPCAFSVDQAKEYLLQAKKLGFSLIIHADQFERGGATLAAEIQTLSADHLEVSNQHDAMALSQAHVIPIVLPGSSIGLGMPFAPARLFIDNGCPLVIASDWNPGSAPMGNLLAQAAIIGAAERLTLAETLAAITIRAAKALELYDRGMLVKGMRADIAAFACHDYREILYHQGSLLPSWTFIKGIIV